MCNISLLELYLFKTITKNSLNLKKSFLTVKAACGISVPQPGIGNWGPGQWKYQVPTTEPPGNFLNKIIFNSTLLKCLAYVYEHYVKILNDYLWMWITEIWFVWIRPPEVIDDKARLTLLLRYYKVGEKVLGMHTLTSTYRFIKLIFWLVFMCPGRIRVPGYWLSRGFKWQTAE